jgi:plasmid maintenance system antidote protein VapI
MKDRILQIISREGLTPAKFAEVIGIQRSAVSHITTGRNKPSLDVVLKILEKYPYIDKNWMLFGTGNMLRDSSSNSNSISNSMQPDLFSNIPPETPTNSPKLTATPEKRKETAVERPQNIIKPSVQEPIVVKKSESKNVSKIMIFYSDNTYETFIPEK